MAGPVEVALVKMEPWTVIYHLPAGVHVEPIKDARGVFCIKVVTGFAKIQGIDVTGTDGVIVGCGLGGGGSGNIGMIAPGGATVSITPMGNFV